MFLRKSQGTGSEKLKQNFKILYKKDLYKDHPAAFPLPISIHCEIYIQHMQLESGMLDACSRAMKSHS